MNLLVVGDVHGCYHTLHQLVQQHWDPSTTVLIQLGDLVNKGPHGGRALSYWMRLQQQYPGQVILLRGNHEQYMLDLQAKQASHPDYLAWKQELKSVGLPPRKAIHWIRTTPLSYYSPQAIVSHAGIAQSSPDPFQISRSDSVLYNRKRLQALPRPQVVGHTIIKEGRPLFSSRENAWYIDTGAWLGQQLSALLFRESGRPQVITVPTLEQDLTGKEQA